MRPALLALALLVLLSAARAEEILIKGGTVVNADGQVEADVLIKEDKIAAVAPGIQPSPSTRVIDAAGKLVMPGGIDPHTHLAMPFMGQVACDDFASGHRAALAGGTTMHIDFALPVNHDLAAGYEEWQRKAQSAVMDYGFHMAVTSWSDKVERDMEALTKRGINSFKVTDEELLAGMKACRRLGALVHAENGDAVVEGQRRIFEAGITGPEGHPLSRPAVLEGEATGRAIRLAAFVGAPLYVVHVMSKDAADEIARAKLAGLRVIGETVASAIALDDSKLWDPDFDVAAAYVMSPPIRRRAAAAAGRAACSAGAAAARRRPPPRRRRAPGGGQARGRGRRAHYLFNSTQKRAGRHDFRLIPNGVNGIEERMHVAWEELVNAGLATPSDYVRRAPPLRRPASTPLIRARPLRGPGGGHAARRVRLGPGHGARGRRRLHNGRRRLTSTAAAQAFNVYPRKGVVAPGSDADVIVFDPAAEHTLTAAGHHSAMDTNIYEGKKVRGKVTSTISRGRLVWHGGQLTVAPNSGRLVPLPPHSPWVFGGLEAHPTSQLTGWAGPPGARTPVRRGGDRATRTPVRRRRDATAREAGGDAGSHEEL
eukprot:scaffold6.g2842.t1